LKPVFKSTIFEQFSLVTKKTSPFTFSTSPSSANHGSVLQNNRTSQRAQEGDPDLQYTYCSMLNYLTVSKQPLLDRLLRVVTSNQAEIPIIFSLTNTSEHDFHVTWFTLKIRLDVASHLLMFSIQLWGGGNVSVGDW